MNTLGENSISNHRCKTSSHKIIVVVGFYIPSRKELKRFFLLTNSIIFFIDSQEFKINFELKSVSI